MSRLCAIGDVTSRVETWDPLSSISNEPFCYIDISSVDRESKEVSATQLILPSDAPSRARQIVKVGDVLVSTVRPNLNAVAEIPEQLDSAIASTGYCVLRSDNERIDSRYLFFWVRSSEFVKEMVKRATGASYPAVSDKIVKDSKLPLPPLPEQKRIASILDKADSIRRKRQEAVRLTEELLRSVFLDMFGDPVTNPKGWKVATVQELCSLIVDCPHTTPQYEGENRIYPCLRTSDLQRGFLDYSSTRYVDEDEYKERVARHQPIAGDVLYSREGERFGIAAMVEEGTSPCLGQRMMLLQANPVIATPAFLWGLMNSNAIYHQATCLVGGATSPHVNVGDIKKLQAVMPPLALQSKFSSIVKTVFGVRKRQIQSREAADTLFNSILHRAFKVDVCLNN